ncbi:MAG: hypothetical protein AMXMBFR36_28760 [Acidobacteriota bacterium]
MTESRWLRLARAIAISHAATLIATASPAQLLGPELQINTYTHLSQGDPAVAASAEGGFVVVWSGSGGPAHSVIRGRTFDEAGEPVGDQFPISLNAIDSENLPDVAADEAGNFLVVWRSIPMGATSQSLVARLFAAGGAPLTGEIPISTGTYDPTFGTAVAAIGGGEFVVVWLGPGGSERPILGRRFDGAGDPVGDPFEVVSQTRGFFVELAIGGIARADEPSDFVVAWDGYRDREALFDVYARRFAATGEPLAEEFLVPIATLPSQSSPRVAMNDAGDFLVTWNEWDEAQESFEVFERRFDSAGKPAGAECRVNATTTGDQGLPSVAADGTDDFVVVWQSRDQDGSYEGIFGQRIAPDGQRIGGEFQVNTYTLGGQYRPAIAGDGTTSFAVVWQSQGQDGSFDGVFGQRLQAPLFFDGFESGDVCGWSAAMGGESCS